MSFFNCKFIACTLPGSMPCVQTRDCKQSFPNLPYDPIHLTTFYSSIAWGAKISAEKADIGDIFCLAAERLDFCLKIALEAISDHQIFLDSFKCYVLDKPQ